MGISPCEPILVLDLGNPQELYMSIFLRQSSIRLIISNWMSSLKASRSLRYWLYRLASSIGNKLQQRSLESINLQLDCPDLLFIMQKEQIKRDWMDAEKRVVEILMAEAEENKRIDQARALHTRDARHLYREEGDRNMRNITEKLNRLEKTLLKKGQCNENYANLSTAKRDKYAELNHLNDQLKRTLAKISGGKGGIIAEEIQKKVISLYNNSVATLNSQDRLNKQLQIVEEKREEIEKEIKQARTELDRGKVQLENIVAMRQLSLRRLEKLLH